MITIYVIVKSLNNNLVLAVNDKKEEFVLFGKGIGFGKKKGDIIEEEVIAKTFRTQNGQDASMILSGISPQILSLTEEIVEIAEKSIKGKLSSTLLISLADHIQFAIDRQMKGIQAAESTLQWEIPFLYMTEFEIGKKALSKIEDDLSVKLPDIEAAFIALHFVNAQNNAGTMEETLLITKIIKSIVKTTQIFFEISIDKDSIDYSRFVTHIRYFMNRQFHGKKQKNIRNKKLYSIIQEQCPKSYLCGIMIKEMLEKEYNLTVNDDEMIYLMIHIERVASESLTKTNN